MVLLCSAYDNKNQTTLIQYIEKIKDHTLNEDNAKIINTICQSTNELIKNAAEDYNTKNYTLSVYGRWEEGLLKECTPGIGDKPILLLGNWPPENGIGTNNTIFSNANNCTTQMLALSCQGVFCLAMNMCSIMQKGKN